jgi:putative ABC transport system substrate-binding protein
VRRREFIKLIFGSAAAAWPPLVRAQQPAIPVVGLLGSASFHDRSHLLAAFRQGMNELGYIEGRTVAFEYRSAEGQYDRLPSLATDLVRHQVAVIVTSGAPASALAAKEATTTIPIVFSTGGDPIALGLVASLNRPGGNITGVSLFNVVLVPKQLELVRELVPKASVIAALVNPDNPNTETEVRELQEAAQALRLQIRVVRVSAKEDFDSAFAMTVQQRVGAIIVSYDSFFSSRRDQIVALAARHSLPAIYHWREFVESGGLISYGTKLTDSYRQTGIYAGKILQGARPADLPVQQPTKFELVLNLKTAKALGLTVPPTLLTAADDVIE